MCDWQICGGSCRSSKNPQPSFRDYDTGSEVEEDEDAAAGAEKVVLRVYTSSSGGRGGGRCCLGWTQKRI